jgi:4-amino-4-deoxy-L-arabinose transferase-like glycosyltransferase
MDHVPVATQGSSMLTTTKWHLLDYSFRPGRWLLERFVGLDETPWPVLWVVAFFLVQAVPATLIRASNLEEGRVIAMARGAVEDGHWLTPFVYGERFAERPVLLSWITALFGEATGGVTLWSLRIPHLCFFLAGALLIYNLLRCSTGKSAAIFGALCWISMPVVAPKFINSEPDIVLSTLLFAAFCVWWQGTSRATMTPSRWASVAILLTLAGLTKGPQPVAYFTLGVGAYLLLKDRKQIPAFIAANFVWGLIISGWYLSVYQQPSDVSYWVVHSRLLTVTGFDWVRDHLDLIKSLAVEMLPGTILVWPAIIIVLGRWRASGPDLMLAAVLYSLICTLVLVLWPGGVASRYAMPATMTLAVICGLMYEQWRQRQPRMIISALVVTYLIFDGLLVRGWIAMPFWPHLFEVNQIGGTEIAGAIRQWPGRLYVTDLTDENMLVYVREPIRKVTLDDLAALATASVAILLPEEERILAQKNPRLQLIHGSDVISVGPPYRIVFIRPSAANNPTRWRGSERTQSAIGPYHQM